MKSALLFAVVLATSACGGKAAPSPEPDPATGPQHAMHEGSGAAMGHKPGHEHGEMAPTITAFHDVLAPRWHAEKGAKRMADTCAAIPEFQRGAAAIIAAPAPQGAVAAAWTDGGKQLAEAITALEAPCKASDAAAFEPAFHRVHESFHRVMEAGGGKHKEGEHAH